MVIQTTGNSYVSQFPICLSNFAFFRFIGMLWHALACLRKEGGQKEGRADGRKGGRTDGRKENRKGGREAGRADGKPEGRTCNVRGSRAL